MYTKKMSKIIKFMENVKPSRIWIDGKCHDVVKYDKKAREFIATEDYKEKFTREYDINIVEEHYHTSFKLASVYYKKIHRYRKITVNDLEKDTGTEINVPTEDVVEDEEKIIIKGQKLEDVIDARLKFHSLISTIRDQERAIQFLGIPVQSEEVRENFENFKETLLADKDNIKGMDKTIFQKPERLHLTLAVFSLMDTIETVQAVNILNDCKSKILSPLIKQTGPLKIQMKGLDCMENNYSKANVMYANAKFSDEQGENTLQKVVDAISNEFFMGGLVRQYKPTVKLHVTLINTKYRKGKDIRKWSKTPFDAASVMEKYKDYDFGMANFDSVQLNYISKIDINSGYYQALSTADF